MNKLDRKLIRDLAKMKGQSLAILLVIAAGVATYVMSMCAYASLVSSKDSYYRDFRFADVFSSVRRAPNAMIPRIKEIPGVAAAEARLVYDVQLDVPEMIEPATARIISVPDSGENRLNKIYIRRGRMIESERTGEVVVSEVFADAHQFLLGDSVNAIINGKIQELTIVGVALSPEYVIQIQPGSLLPDKKRFGIFWMSELNLASAFDMTGAFNSVTIKMAHDGNSQAVMDELDRLLKPFGSVGAYDRDHQLSHQYLSDELQQLRGMAVMAPAIFLSVAAFLLNIVISRIISKQREQIAALKAFGYTNFEVGMHYLNLVMIISLAGTASGMLFGFWLAANMTVMYQEFYKFPLLEFRIDKFAVLMSFLLTTAAAVIGTFVSVRSAVKLPPAEAMRPEPPPSFKPTWFEKALPSDWLTSEMRMVVRNLARKPVKSALSILGISMAVAIMILGNFSIDSLNYLINFQFRLAQRQDLTVSFIEPATATVMYEMRNIPGVMDSETMRAVATRIHAGHRSKRIGIMGLQPAPKLYRLLDANERVVKLPEFGIMLNTSLARKLEVKLGDVVTIEVLEGERPTVTAEVTALVEEYAGLNAYMNKQQLHRMLKESSVATGAFLSVDSEQIETVFHELQQRPGVGSVLVKNAAIKSFEETVAENISVMRGFIIMFATVIAIGVVYNSARISLSEQSRDLATMRVMGFTRREVSLVLLGEIIVFTIAAIPIGWLIGYAFASSMVAGLDTDNYRIPLVVSPQTFALAAAVVIIATFFSGLVVQRQVSRLDLVAVLKTRE